ncbi:MAG: ABC transporter ATP-binding protein [Clostridia bacterium]|nr:ABC transporter ATP-binding protein [Clostridia bacterium]
MIEFRDIYKIYNEGEAENEVRAVDGISFFIGRGEFVGIVGASGSGKSTCMNIIGCLDVPTRGQYLLNGTDVSTMSEKQLAHVRNRELGFVFQQYNLIPKLTILENVELPLLYKGIGQSERRELSFRALEKVGLADRVKKYPAQLSGGQQQRASIARALAGNPPVILADEPTGALDSKTGRDILEFIKKLNEEDGTTIVLITHDPSIAEECPRVLKIHDGKIIDDIRKQDIK